MEGTPVEKRFAVLCQIVRAQHFAWREAVAELCPDVDPAAVANRMWEITGRQTAEAYLRHIDPSQPLAAQVARSIVWSSESMGEEATWEASEGADEAFVRHTRCPWFDWHERLGLLAEDRPGCDSWFRSTVEEINRTLGTSLRTETTGSLPDGETACTRRLWVESDG